MGELSNKDSVLFKGPANHMFNHEGVGGKVYLTKDFLIFISHNININNHTYKIPIGNISNFKYPAFPPTALQFTDNKGNIETFIIYKRKTWIKRIEQLQQNIK